MTVLSKLSRSSTSTSAKAKRKPVRKALLVAITYKEKQEGIDELRSPHKDARDWRDLLLTKYKFRECDITTMLDDQGVPEHLLPTRENILTQIKLLVEDARPGDKFMFYYAGHTDQVPSDSIHEEDGLDEAIIPYVLPGQTQRLIIDNELRDLLVDPLPIGASLTAIFDSCHSGTLLDLDHYVCNNVWFPWCNKGLRDICSKPRLRVLRRNGYDADRHGHGVVKVDLNLVRTVSDLGTAEDTEAPQAADTEVPLKQPSARKPSVRIYERARTSTDTMFKRNTLVDALPPTAEKGRRFVITRSSTMEAKRRDSFMEARRPRRGFSFHNFTFTGVAGNIRDIADAAVGMLTGRRCSSPDSWLECNGWCRPGLRKTKAHVVSISACQDPQKTWEGRAGWTMTQSLISVLHRDPHPPYRELIKTVGHDLHKSTTLKLHRWSAKQISEWRASDKPLSELPSVEVVNGSEPTLGSMDPLAEDERFHL